MESFQGKQSFLWIMAGFWIDGCNFLFKKKQAGVYI